MALDRFLRRGDIPFACRLVCGAAHFEGHLILLLQLLANLMERGKLPPARPHGTGPRNPVAFAGRLHTGFDSLQSTRRQRQFQRGEEKSLEDCKQFIQQVEEENSVATILDCIFSRDGA